MNWNPSLKRKPKIEREKNKIKFKDSETTIELYEMYSARLIELRIEQHFILLCEWSESWCSI